MRTSLTHSTGRSGGAPAGWRAAGAHPPICRAFVPADGSRHREGAVTVRLADGSTVTRSPDGSVARRRSLLGWLAEEHEGAAVLVAAERVDGSVDLAGAVSVRAARGARRAWGDYIAAERRAPAPTTAPPGRIAPSRRREHRAQARTAAGGDDDAPGESPVDRGSGS